MSSSVTVSPLTRIEGHLAVHTETEPLAEENAGHRVTIARCAGEMFRGFERILQGRDPMDAQQITQRICGVCPVSHGIASVRAQEMAYGIRPNHNGRLLQNLIFAANYLQSHILHFYHLAALDFVDVTAILKYTGADRALRAVKAWVESALSREDAFAAAPFLPRYEADYVKSDDRNVALLGHYVEALDMRRICHEMGAVFGARLPHSTALIPGGVTQVPTLERVLTYRARLKRVAEFVESVYIPDLLEVAQEFPSYFDIGHGCGNYLCYGVFELNDSGEKLIPPGVVIDGKWEALEPRNISEDVACSRYASGTPRHPSEGITEPEPERSGAYSWLKAPRYRGRVMEVGPLARVVANYMNPKETWIKREVDAVIGSLKLPVNKLFSVLGRHVARGLECRWIAAQASRWLDAIELDAPATCDFDLCERGEGYGLTEAPRGALGHWLTIEDYRIARYQCVVPTTWNCSPRDGQGQPGPVETALEGALLQNPEQPIEIGRIVRSFDPCLACAVH
ncbi:MAG: nickel-dependent hydrogenase large subunit [Phycisphaerae bacterium]|nr:nickel-dependent hydrogenase large subunit [Phycisphaerae bacterium]